MADNKKKKNTKAGIIFWLIFAIAILIAFLIARGRISEVLDETGFFKEVMEDNSSFISDALKKTTQEIDTIIDILPQEKESVVDLQTTETSTENSEQEIPTSEEEKKPVTTAPPKIKTEDTLTLAKPETTETPTNTVKTKLILYFVMIEGDGTVVRKEVSREIDKTKIPLTTSLKALLQGPTISELEKGTMSLIPEGTKLLSATITDKTAFLNFSDEFQYNKFGVEGYLGQLMQIVYTATSFSSIDSVQFLINGQKESYLGGEGVWIGSPLPRSTFK